MPSHPSQCFFCRWRITRYAQECIRICIRINENMQTPCKLTADISNYQDLIYSQLCSLYLCIDIHSGEQVPEYFCIYVHLHFQHILPGSLYTPLWVHFLKTTLVNTKEFKSRFFSLTFC